MFLWQMLTVSPSRLIALLFAFWKLLVLWQRLTGACPLAAGFAVLALAREQCKVSIMNNSTFSSLSSFVQHPLLSRESNLHDINGPGSWCVSISHLCSCSAAGMGRVGRHTNGRHMSFLAAPVPNAILGAYRCYSQTWGVTIMCPKQGCLRGKKYLT